MAFIFSLSTECGTLLEDAESFAKHFHQISWQLKSGVESKCNTGIFQDSEDNWWVRVYPSGVSQIGITTPEDAYQMTEIGILLYQRLHSAPPFRYALVGVEVDEFRTYSELLSTNSNTNLNFSGLVLSKALWQEMNCPIGFRIFTSGYLWKPYEGEVYKPLLVSSELRDKLDELFAIQS
ncbi:hypothetical protein F7734_16600 [Scytonema sp. UIC 10036]|uniref:hypothetical protein n=1 Tax=Scytonema sp. UIC 10036 TaxID=2304196 RepID=UPI0012DAEADA|nr:hypothetical protein [Scytonema sp. UIC 10036]MUG93930.1 hypothetical protein [Scytonema sp. UIC 10036]